MVFQRGKITAEGDAATLDFGAEFNKEHCLTNAEVLLLLEDISAKRQIDSQSIPLPPPSQIFLKCQEHLNNFTRIKNKDIIREIRQTLVNDEELAEFEMAQLANLSPETTDEAKTLIPSLHGKKEDNDDLQRLLDDLSALRRFQSIVRTKSLEMAPKQGLHRFFVMKNLVLLRHRNWNYSAGNQNIQQHAVSYDENGTWVYGGSFDRLYKLDASLEQPVQSKKFSVNLTEDVPRNLSVLKIQSFPGDDLVFVGHHGEIVKMGVNQTCDLIGKIADGILACEWSPSRDLLALVTGKHTLLLLTASDFDVIHEGPIEICSENGEKFVNVGWGKKETQFHGSAGKNAAKPAETILMKPAPGDNKIPAISWRGDGQYFAISQVDHGSSARRIRVFDRFGSLQSVSEPVAILEGTLAWIPNGSLITSTAIHPDGRRQVVFFERNGLRHGEFDLKRQDSVRELAWNAESDVLSLSYIDGTGELWSRSNYHWYLKQVIPEQLTSFTWHQSGYNALGIRIDGSLLFMSFGWSYYRSQADETDLVSIVAVIDGHEILITPFAIANVSPPASLFKYTCPGVPRKVALWSVPNKPEFLMAYALGSTVSLVRGQVKDRECTFETVGEVREENNVCISDVLLTSDYLLVQNSLGNVSVYSQTLSFYSRVECPADSVLTPCGTFVQRYNGQFLRLTDLEDSRICGDRGFCHQVIFFDGHLVGLHQGFLSVDGHEIMSGCAFIYQTPAFLIVGQAAEKSIRFLPKAVDPIEWPSLLKSTNEEATRRMEAGSEIVVASMHSASVVLQAPRGNLETVYPRALVLASVRSSLSSLDYRKAYMDCRRHRIDLNILYDVAPETFLKTADMFVKQVNQVDYLNLFVASLRSENTALTKYPGFISEAPETVPIEDKVNVVCRKIREVILSKDDSDKYLETVMTTYVCQQPPQLEAALNAIVGLSQQPDLEPEVLEQSLSYLIFLVDVDKLYKVALGMYNLPLALSIARRSQNDPKEYVGFLEELAALDHESLRRFRIDASLGIHHKALGHYWDCVKAAVEGQTFEGFLDYMTQHGLFNEAITLLQGDVRLSQVYQLFAEARQSANDFSGAAILFRLAGNPAKSLEMCIEAGLWQQALSISKEPLVLEQIHDKLVDQRRYLEAFNLVMSHYPVETKDDFAVRDAVEGGLWLEALTIASLDLPSFMEEAVRAADLLEVEIDEIRSTFEEKSSRLMLLQRHILDPPKSTGGPLTDISDALSEMTFKTGGTQLTRTSTATSLISGTSTHRNRKKAERKMMKAKPGSPFERDGLRLLLTDLIERVKRIHASVNPLLTVLSTNGELHTASALQSSILDLTTIIANFSTAFRTLQAKIDVKHAEELAAYPVPAELRTAEQVGDEVVQRAAWHEAFKLSSEFTRAAWSLPFL